MWLTRAQQCSTRGSLAQLTAVLWSRRGPGIRRARCRLECRRDRNLRTSAVDPLQPVDVLKSSHSTLGSAAPRRGARMPRTIPNIRLLNHLVGAQQERLRNREPALAVLSFITSSNFVGCRTGNSAGLAALRILPV